MDKIRYFSIVKQIGTISWKFQQNDRCHQQTTNKDMNSSHIFIQVVFLVGGNKTHSNVGLAVAMVFLSLPRKFVRVCSKTYYYHQSRRRFPAVI